ELARFVDDKLTVVVLANGDNANPSVIALGVADLYTPGLIPERAVARVDPRVFDAYVGQYQPNPSLVLTVTRDGDKLMMGQGSNAEKRELLPENESDFFTNENRHLTFSFVKDEKGQVTHLVLQTAGREIWRAKKIK